MLRFSRFLLSRRVFTKVHKPKYTAVNQNFERLGQKTCMSYECRIPFSSSSDPEKHVLGRIERKFQLIYTCKVCNSRNSKQISHQAYTKGVVIVKCDVCKSNHLIADNLGWFPNVKEKNIEDILASKGETVKKNLEKGDCLEYVNDAKPP